MNIFCNLWEKKTSFNEYWKAKIVGLTHKSSKAIDHKWLKLHVTMSVTVTVSVIQVFASTKLDHLLALK